MRLYTIMLLNYLWAQLSGHKNPLSSHKLCFLTEGRIYVNHTDTQIVCKLSVLAYIQQTLYTGFDFYLCLFGSSYNIDVYFDCFVYLYILFSMNNFDQRPTNTHTRHNNSNDKRRLCRSWWEECHLKPTVFFICVKIFMDPFFVNLSTKHHTMNSMWLTGCNVLFLFFTCSEYFHFSEAAVCRMSELYISRKQTSLYTISPLNGRWCENALWH